MIILDGAYAERSFTPELGGPDLSSGSVAWSSFRQAARPKQSAEGQGLYHSAEPQERPAQITADLCARWVVGAPMYAT